MSTRASIIRQNADDSFDSIYCHFDGYPSHVGALLLEHYQDIAKIDALISLGDLSSLAPQIGEAHDWDDRSRLREICHAYGRDRGEEGTEAKHYANAEELAGMLKESWTKWVYIYRVAEAKWFYSNNASPTWIKLCGPQKNLEELTAEAVAE